MNAMHSLLSHDCCGLLLLLGTSWSSEASRKLRPPPSTTSPVGVGAAAAATAAVPPYGTRACSCACGAARCLVPSPSRFALGVRWRLAPRLFRCLGISDDAARPSKA